MRVKPARDRSNAGGCEPPTSSARHWGAIARRSAILLGSTAAMALSIAQPVSAISINDQVATAAGGIANYYDAGNRRSRRADPGAFSVDGNDHRNMSGTRLRPSTALATARNEPATK
jgi:hypothetical protein